jgi:hypothetical protein
MNEAFLLKEDINNGWFVATNVDFEDNTNIRDIAIECKFLLVEL